MKSLSARLLGLLICFLFLETYSFAFQPSVNLVSYECENKHFREVLKDIKRLANIVFHYAEETVSLTSPVTLKVVNVTLQQLLDTLCSNQPVYIEYENGLHNVHRKLHYAPRQIIVTAKPSLKGRVTTMEGTPVPNATISNEHNVSLTVSDDDGTFEITRNRAKRLIISCVGFLSREIEVSDAPLTIRLKPHISPMETFIKAGYHNFTKKEGTPSVNQIEASEFLGREILPLLPINVPGVWNVPVTGTHGTISRFQIRNAPWLRNTNGTDNPLFNNPLLIIDGVPIPSHIVNQFRFAGNDPNAAGAKTGGISNYRFINIEDIESVAILKDADATAIYGSRGANGVIIINTKKPKAGAPRITAKVNHGFAEARQYYEMLQTAQYLRMRDAAMKNDQLPITKENAPDLYDWSPAAYTDFNKLFMGGQAKFYNAHVAASGGNSTLGFRVGVGYTKEGNIWPEERIGKRFYDRDITIHGSIIQKSVNNKVIISIDGLYSSNKTYSTANDLTIATRTAPNAPQLLDDENHLIWYKDFSNPWALLLSDYQLHMENIVGHAKLDYLINDNIKLSSNLGLNHTNADEVSTYPIAAQYPSAEARAMSEFGSLFLTNSVFEQMAEIRFKINKHIKLTSLSGYTIIKQKINKRKVEATGYTSDLLLFIQQKAAKTESENHLNEYAYFGPFTSLKANIRNRFYVNITIRRDGSSRFGMLKQYGTFMSIGGSWIMVDENRNATGGFLSFFKLRSSYGNTGNDQIPDYGQFQLYAVVPAQRPYGGISGFEPTGHANQEYSWEEIRKLEIATDLTFRNKVNFTFGYYHNMGTNQLISQSLPNFTGFGHMIRNFPAKVLCRGFELLVQKKLDESKKISWGLTFVGTIPKTTLKSFPKIESSNYLHLEIGKSLTAQKTLHLEGVDPNTGLYTFKDFDRSGELDQKDYKYAGHLDPEFYGGFQSSFQYNGWKLDLACDYVKQKGIDPAISFSPMKYNHAFSNVPIEFLDYWSPDNPSSSYPKWSAQPGTGASNNYELYKSSDAVLVDASFLRLKYASISYTCKPWKISSKTAVKGKIYMLAENALVLTPFKGADPSSQNISGIPPLKRFSLGFQFSII